MNLLCGIGGIILSLKGNWQAAFWLMVAGAGFDFFDGMVARLLKVTSEIGKQLDSLSDMVTFGLLPSIMMYQMLLSSNHEFMQYSIYEIRLLPLIAFLIAAFSALRLAKFNVDKRQTSSFIGLPTPANALLIGALSYANNDLCKACEIYSYFSNPWLLISLSIILSYLLVAELPLFSLKFKSLKWKDNKVKFIFLIISLLLIITFYKWIYMAVIIIIPLYIILSVFVNFSLKDTK